jgi:hypothetical protein
MVQLVFLLADDELSRVWDQLSQLSFQIGDLASRMPALYVQGDDPAAEGTYPSWGSIWVRIDDVPNAVFVRANTGTSDWARVWPADVVPEEPTP